MNADIERYRFFSENHQLQLSRSEAILSTYKLSMPAIGIFAEDTKKVRLTQGVRLVSVGNMTDFPAEPKYPSIRLPNEKSLISSWMADAEILVFSDMYVVGLAAEGKPITCKNVICLF